MFAFRILAIACLLFGVALCATTQEHEEAFAGWMHQHAKSYSNEEFGAKFETFKSHYDNIQSHNAGAANYKLALNQFSDLTWEEFSSTYFGYTPAVAQQKRSCTGAALCNNGACCPTGYTCTTSHMCISCPANQTACAATAECCPSNLGCGYGGCNGAQIATGSPVAATVNWTAQGYVTAVKNQGQCGSCWSYSASGAIEAAHNIKHALKGASVVTLSEQNLIDCSSAQGNQGCNGGLPENAFKYVQATGGIDTMASYPDTSNSNGAAGTCAYKSANSGAAISGYTSIKKGDETTLGTAVASQPVSVGICAAPSFQSYAYGVYDDPACGTGNVAMNHAVLITGYGTDSSAGAYWYVKNSWGTSWGMQGYFLLAKGKNMCGVAGDASYPAST